jgi:hypothetical protein
LQEVLGYVNTIREGDTIVFSNVIYSKALFPINTKNGDDCTTCHSNIYKPQGKRSATMSEYPAYSTMAPYTGIELVSREILK